MSSNSTSTNPSPELVFNLDATAWSKTLIATVGVTILSLFLISLWPDKSGYPLVNPPRLFQPQVFKKLEFLQNGIHTLYEAKKKYAGRPFRMITELGEILVLSPSHIQMMRNEADLSFSEVIAIEFHSYLPGFQPFGILKHEKQIVQAVARKQLTRTLNIVTEPLSSEAIFALDKIFGNSPDWQEVPIKEHVLDVVARLTSRVFLGDELCRNEDWLEITKSYTVNAFKVAVKMQLVPHPFRFLLRWFSSDCAIVSQQFNRVVEIITPVIENRRKLKAEALSKGTEMPIYKDATEWAEEESGGEPYDPAVFQLALSFAAIHTTTDLITQTLLQLAQQPALIERLREEIINVLRVEGWKKSALFNMKLLDSAIKEAQRIKPNSLLGMRRVATKDVILSDKTVILKGQRVMGDSTSVHDPDVFPNPKDFDIDRFLRLREQPNFTNKAQLVSTSPEHPLFGHGMHACPGRFFAANEVKIALCHLLLMYDWKLSPENHDFKPVVSGVSLVVDPRSKVMFRRRKEEIDLASLEYI